MLPTGIHLWEDLLYAYVPILNANTVVVTCEAFYHYKYPVPGIIDAVEQEKNQSNQPLEENEKENNEDSSKEESEEINHEQKESS